MIYFYIKYFENMKINKLIYYVIKKYSFNIYLLNIMIKKDCNSKKYLKIY